VTVIPLRFCNFAVALLYVSKQLRLVCTCEPKIMGEEDEYLPPPL
jgi:hypothetical protein